METVDILTEGITSYLSGLDWTYIVTTILLCGFLSNDNLLSAVKSKRAKATLSKVPMIVRVVIISTLYAAFTYWFRDYKGKQQVEMLFSSLVFSIFFHKLVLSYIHKRILKTSTNGNTRTTDTDS